MIDPKLKEWATERQAEFVDALIEHKSERKAAYALGVAKSTLHDALDRLKKRAAKQGYSPAHDLTHPVAPGQMLKGASTLYKDGKPVLQWVKTSADKQLMEELMREVCAGMLEDLPQVEVKQGPDHWQSDVIPWVQIGDAHLGMLAHAAEIGENFDLKIAEQEICAAISILIDELPSCERLVINDLGDFTHYENFSATTEASGHPLDFDTRFPKMIKVYSRVIRFIVEKALEKARNVDVIVNQGNHSRTNDIWMAELLRVAYGHTGRVNVLNNDSVFIAYRMGNTLVMTHHSDKCRPAQLAHVMTNDYRKDYGETEFHYIDVGHVHHGMVMKEHPGIFVESFNHLAALDKWAHDSGYRNRKSITVVLRSKTYGEVGRRVLPIQEIRDRLKNAKQSTPAERVVYTV
ncbi:MAG: hypothetical protein ACM34A_12235 [Bacillota bacterium]